MAYNDSGLNIALNVHSSYMVGSSLTNVQVITKSSL